MFEISHADMQRERLQTEFQRLKKGLGDPKDSYEKINRIIEATFKGDYSALANTPGNQDLTSYYMREQLEQVYKKAKDRQVQETEARVHEPGFSPVAEQRTLRALLEGYTTPNANRTSGRG